MPCATVSRLFNMGRANGVRLDAAKGSTHVVSRAHPVGSNFRILGVTFDPKLIMDDAVHECAAQAGWRLRTLMRTQRYHTVMELVALFRSQVVSFVDYRTAAIAHASTSVLMAIDRVQD